MNMNNIKKQNKGEEILSYFYFICHISFINKNKRRKEIWTIREKKTSTIL